MMSKIKKEFEMNREAKYQKSYLMIFIIMLFSVFTYADFSLDVALVERTPEEMVIPTVEGVGSFVFTYYGTWGNLDTSVKTIRIEFAVEIPSKILDTTKQNTLITTFEIPVNYYGVYGPGYPEFNIKQSYMEFLKSKSTGDGNGLPVVEQISFKITATFLTNTGSVHSTETNTQILDIKFLTPVKFEVFKPNTQELWGKIIQNGYTTYPATEEEIAAYTEELITPIAFSTTATGGYFSTDGGELSLPTMYHGWKNGSWIAIPSAMGLNEMHAIGYYNGYLNTIEAPNGILLYPKLGAYTVRKFSIWHRKALTGIWHVFYNKSDVPDTPDGADEVFEVRELYKKDFPKEMTATDYSIDGIGRNGTVLTAKSEIFTENDRKYVGVKGSFTNINWKDTNDPTKLVPKTFYTSYVLIKRTDEGEYFYLLVGEIENGTSAKIPFCAYIELGDVDFHRIYREEENGKYWTTEIPRTGDNKNTNKPGPRIFNSPNAPDNTQCATCDSCAWDPVTQQQVCFDNQVADPININNLEVIESATDMVIKSRGISFEFKRTYRSRVLYNGPIGWGWEHSYNKQLVSDPNNENIVILYDGMGRGDPYYIDEKGYSPPKGYYNKIVKEADGTLVLRHRNGSMCKFNPLGGIEGGKLSSLYTRCGDRLKFVYDGTGLLIKVVDSYNREITLTYDIARRIRKISAFTGQEVYYDYDEEGNLVSVKSMAVSGTSNGNDFPDGKEWQYSYSKEYEDNRLNHNLLTVTAPNEIAVIGDPRIVNYYNDNDELIMQSWGGTNGNGSETGGEVTYSRETLNDGVDPENIELARIKVTVIDRNGNETIFYFNKNNQLIKKEEKTRGIRPNAPESYITSFTYNESGLLKEQILPSGRKTVYEYDENNTDIFQRSNLLSVTTYPDSKGGDQAFHKISYEYEPVFQQIIRVTGPRGNDPNYIPQNGGVASKERYSIEYVPDYFEGGLDTPGCACGYTLRELKDKFGINITSIESKLNQGDLNGDGQYSLCGNLIITKYPKVNLRANSPQIAKEGSSIQIVETKITYNKFSQVSQIETPEGEITLYLYYPENDPEGDGQNILTGQNSHGYNFDTVTGGYLKEVIKDFSHSSKYRGDSDPVQTRTKIGYNHTANIVWTIDGRGVRTDFEVNQLNQIVSISVASDVSQAIENGLAPFSYKSRIYYDYNDNVVKTDLQYKDGNNPDLPEWLVSTVIYDILDKPIEAT
ncbi:MAG: hypothetical protein KJ956_14565, partial [Actinobacteria bacterium]|nr:hypothetical protein [Actinomycetota bacterium]